MPFSKLPPALILFVLTIKTSDSSVYACVHLRCDRTFTALSSVPRTTLQRSSPLLLIGKNGSSVIFRAIHSHESWGSELSEPVPPTNEVAACHGFSILQPPRLSGTDLQTFQIRGFHTRTGSPGFGGAPAPCATRVVSYPTTWHLRPQSQWNGRGDFQGRAGPITRLCAYRGCFHMFSLNEVFLHGLRCYMFQTYWLGVSLSLFSNRSEKPGTSAGKTKTILYILTTTAIGSMDLHKRIVARA